MTIEDKMSKEDHLINGWYAVVIVSILLWASYVWIFNTWCNTYYMLAISVIIGIAGIILKRKALAECTTVGAICWCLAYVFMTLICLSVINIIPHVAFSTGV